MRAGGYGRADAGGRMRAGGYGRADTGGRKMMKRIEASEKDEYREHSEPCSILPGSCWFLLVPAESDVKIVILYLVPYNLGSKYLFSNTF